jgi:hypothetical protein
MLQLTIVLMRVTISCCKEQSIAVGRQANTRLPDTTTSTIASLEISTLVRCLRSNDRSPLCGNVLVDNVYTDDHASVVEQVAVTTEASINIVSDLHKRGSLQDYAADEGIQGFVVCNTAVDQNGIARNVLKCVKRNTMEVVDTIRSARIARNAIVRDVGLGEKVCDLGLGIDDRRADDTDRVGNVGTSNVRLQEGWVN